MFYYGLFFKTQIRLGMTLVRLKKRGLVFGSDIIVSYCSAHVVVELE